MAKIKRLGAPTRSTKGSVGDIYIDLKARQAYVCTSAYRSSTGSVDYTWRPKEEEVEEEELETPVEAPKQFEEPAIEEIPEVPEVPANKPLKNDYHKHYKH